MIKRLGNYQRTVLRGIKRKGCVPTSIKSGYSRQVKSLRRRGLIKEVNGKFCLTDKAKRDKRI